MASQPLKYALLGKSRPHLNFIFQITEIFISYDQSSKLIDLSQDQVTVNDI